MLLNIRSVKWGCVGAREASASESLEGSPPGRGCEFGSCKGSGFARTRVGAGVFWRFSLRWAPARSRLVAVALLSAILARVPGERVGGEGRGAEVGGDSAGGCEFVESRVGSVFGVLGGGGVSIGWSICGVRE